MAMKHEMVVLDADQQIHLLAVLADFHTYVLEAWHCGEEFDDEGPLLRAIMCSNMEGRCIGNNLCQEDLDLIADWEEEVERWKECHDGNIVVPDV